MHYNITCQHHGWQTDINLWIQANYCTLLFNALFYRKTGRKWNVFSSMVLEESTRCPPSFTPWGTLSSRWSRSMPMLSWSQVCTQIETPRTRRTSLLSISWPLNCPRYNLSMKIVQRHWNLKRKQRSTWTRLFWKCWLHHQLFLSSYTYSFFMQPHQSPIYEYPIASSQ